jgi:hypothetical protein
VALLLWAVGTVVAVSPAAAEPGGETLPVYGGTQFPVIHSAADPEAYSWRVELGPTQTLRAVSETEAVVEYPDGTTAFTITADKAHDFEGTEVPTTLEVSEGDVITVVVHHREGSYVYPVSPGEPWIVISEGTIVTDPLPEGLLRETERVIIEANPPAVIPRMPIPAAASCKVPALDDLSLKVAKARLRAAHCSVGEVHLAAGATAGKGKVVKQFRAVGTELGAGAPVAVKIGSR